MKKFLPAIVVVVTMFLAYKMMSSGTLSPVALIGLSVAITMAFAFIRPKKTGPSITTEAISDLLGEFSKDAFTDDSQLSKDFQAAVTNILGNMPKAAIAKLTKLAPQCRNDQERYAVSMLRAQAYCTEKKYEEAIQDYNQAVVLNPSSELAMTIGSCQQRIGELWKAIDSYEFALDLDPQNIAARSALATAWVANRDYHKALKEAELALDLDAENASALATTAICYGLLGDDLKSAAYTSLAADQGYNRQKIENTIQALKK